MKIKLTQPLIKERAQIKVANINKEMAKVAMTIPFERL